MPPRQRDPDVARVVEGIRGRVRMRMELTIRFDYGSIVPWVRHVDGALHAVAGPDSVWLRTPVAGVGRELDHPGRLHRGRGRAGPLHAHLARLAPAGPAPHRPDPGPRRHRGLVGRVGQPHRLPGRLAGRGDPLPDHPEGADLRPHRRDRGRPHHLAPRAARRGPQLGLPLLLAAGRHLHPVGADAGRAGRRGQGVARVAAAGRRRPAAADADPVRRGRRAPHHRAGAGLAARLRGVAAGADRQRGRQPVPARRLRRGHGHPAPGPAHRPGERRGGLGPAAGAARVPRVELAPAGRGHLGDPRPPAALHPLQGDGLGGPGPGHQGGRADGPRRPGRPLAGGPRASSTTRSAARATTPSATPSCSSTGPTTSTPACSDPPGRVPARRRPAGQGHGGRHPARTGGGRPRPPLPARGSPPVDGLPRARARSWPARSGWPTTWP